MDDCTREGILPASSRYPLLVLRKGPPDSLAELLRQNRDLDPEGTPPLDGDVFAQFRGRIGTVLPKEKVPPLPPHSQARDLAWEYGEND
jgi:hypothetical protein